MEATSEQRTEHQRLTLNGATAITQELALRDFEASLVMERDTFATNLQLTDDAGVIGATVHLRFSVKVRTKAVHGSEDLRWLADLADRHGATVKGGILSDTIDLV